MNAEQLVGQRIKAKREAKKFTQETLAQALGLKRQAVFNWETGKNGPSRKTLARLAEILDTTQSYFLTGKDESEEIRKEILADRNEAKRRETKMPAVVQVDQSGKENIVYVDRKAKGGYLNGHADPEYIEALPAFTAPKLADRSYRAFEIEGPSMMPTLYPTDIVIASYVEDYRHIKESYIYIVVTVNDGILAKRLLNRLNDPERGYLMARSDNPAPEHAQYPIYEDNIIEIWRVHAKITWNLAPPDRSLERRLDDFEINFDAMAQRVGELEQMILNRLSAK